MTERRPPLLILALCLTLLPLPSIGAGSWVANQTGPRVALADADVRSLPLASPSDEAKGHHITSVSWRFSLPDASRQRVLARLCHPVRCVPIRDERGLTEALAGLDADVPLAFHFRLVAVGPAVQTEGLQVIVNYR